MFYGYVNEMVVSVNIRQSINIPWQIIQSIKIHKKGRFPGNRSDDKSENCLIDLPITTCVSTIFPRNCDSQFHFHEFRFAEQCHPKFPNITCFSNFYLILEIYCDWKFKLENFKILISRCHMADTWSGCWVSPELLSYPRNFFTAAHWWTFSLPDHLHFLLHTNNCELHQAYIYRKKYL